MVKEKYLENEIFSRSGKSQGILWIAREIRKGLEKSGNSKKKWLWQAVFRKIILFKRGKDVLSQR